MSKIWDSFKGTKWKKSIDVRDFIMKNYTQYSGDASFLQGPTERTKKLLAKVEKLFAKEQKKGVLGIDVKRTATINSHPAGYVDKKNEIIVGLQSDKPLVRLVSPFSGLKCVKAASGRPVIIPLCLAFLISGLYTLKTPSL